MKRYLSIDFGLKRLGIAVSNEGKTIAFPLTTIQAEKNLPETAKKIASYIDSLEYPIEKIILGYPLLLSGKKSDMTLTVEQFAQELRKALEIEIELFDERLSSKSIDANLRDLGVNRKKRDKASDEQAACVLLQNYLDQRK